MTEPIRLGLMPPLTGLVSIYGAEISQAARIACDEINQGGGLLGRPLALVIEDDGSLPDSAVAAATRLLDQHGCVALIGNLLSHSRIAVAAQVAAPRRIPLLNFSFYEGSISGRYFFHFAALPNQQIDPMIPWMGARYGLKMFFAGSNYEWPRGSIDAAQRCLKALGGDIVGEEYLPINAGAEQIDALLERVARSGADVFVPYFAGLDQMALLTRFTALGLKRRMAVVMGHYDEVMVSGLAPEVREGFYSTNTYFMSVDTAENRRLLARLAALPGIDGIWPHGNGMLSNFGEATYLCVHAFAAAVRAAGCTDAEALVDALEQVRLHAPQGEVAMDAASHHARVNTYLSRCNADGTFTIIEAFGSSAPVLPERYRLQARSANLRRPSPTRQAVTRLAAEVGDAMRSARTAQQILDLADLAVVATDEAGCILNANRPAGVMFGYTREEMIGMPVHDLLPPHFRQRHAELMRGFCAGAQSALEMGARRDVTGYRKDGSFFPIEASVAKVRVDQGWLLVVTLRDLSAQKQAEGALLRQSTHDGLTGLANRALIRERLGNALARAQGNTLGVGLLVIGLDGFKQLNDAHGHDAGDLLLKAVAACLMEQVRPGDTVARLGGDEFAVLCEHIEQPEAISAVAGRINAALRLPIEVNDNALFVTASIGIALSDGAGHSADDLLRAADSAMFEAKQRGRDGWRFFSASQQAETQQRLAIAQGLHTALENGELSVRFQPIVAAADGRIVGAELLLRWHPAGGEVAPGIFIPIAEASGAIIAIGNWVFRRGCAALADWQRRWGERAPAYLSINVSARQLGDAGLADQFGAMLRASGADPGRILIEVTETSLMADVETSLRVLGQLTALGLRVAVDDFGTGYSSLAQLTRMPVAVLKIDKAFIDGIEDKPESRAVVRAIVGLGRALALELVAEGVENGAQLAELRASGCEFIQGYLFHRPLDEATFIAAYGGEL